MFPSEGYDQDRDQTFYRAQFVDPTFYQQTCFTFHENTHKKTALWVNIEDWKSGKLLVVPLEFLVYF
ncbi:hypothetical protein PJF56_03110 [Roseofilum sp. BLCC_M91]|uniref:Uncharacterized protein n=1 Tax=Roseofilum halophilum BLCC-M91 TaxID=3022259 RepID=A0ABT7BGE6_9CYAN|nr:hypothetical protein [Roseofilum halophilum]MDJ1177847.1 hypothetical protein [Roseofilum halophilum BLCC-M91]